MRALTVVALLVCLSGLTGCQRKEEPISTKPPVSQKDPLLGEWLSDTDPTRSGPLKLVFNEDGTVVMSPPGEKPETLKYVCEPIADWQARRKAEIGKTDKKAADDFVKAGTELFGPTAEVVTMTRVPTEPDEPGAMTLFFYADPQILMIPFGDVFARPGTSALERTRETKANRPM